MLIGGLVFGPAMSRAHDGRDNVIADAGDTSNVVRHAPAKRMAQAPQPPKPPRTPQPPQPRKPPKPPQAPGSGFSISINGNKIDLSGIEGMVRGQLQGVREMIKNNPSIPPQVRDRLLARIDKVNASVDKRLAKIKTKGIDHLGEEMEALGDEIEQALDGLDQDLEQLGDKIGKDIGKKLKDKNFKFDFSHDDDQDDDNDDDDDVGNIPMTPDIDDVSSEDMRDALENLKSMAITPQQKEQIQKIRAKSDADVGNARKQLDELSKKLEVALANPKTNDAEISRYVDQISQQEAAIRKARILAWHSARRILDDSQRQRIEAAAKKKSH